MIETAAPFSLDRSADFLRGFAPCADGPVCSAGTVEAAFALPEGPTAVRVRQVGTALVHDVNGPGDPEQAVRDWLGPDDPVADFYALADGDPLLAGPISTLRGLHQVRFRTLAEGAIWFAMTHRVPQRQALGWKRELVRRHGHPVGAHLAFPTLDELLALPDLAELLHSPDRADRVRTILDGVRDLGEDFLRTAPFADARTALLAIRGVGPFTADGILFRALGRLGPIDVGAPAEARERYGDWIGYWSHYQRAAGIPHTR